MTFADLVVATLEEARARIHHGHCKGQGYAIIDGRECFCAVAALAASSRTVRIPNGDTTITIAGQQIFDAGMSALSTVLPPGWTSVPAYNDATSQTDVSRLYGNAISAVRKVAA